MKWPKRPGILLALAGLNFLHAAALFVFTKGFVTTRVELPHRSQCTDFSRSSADALQHAAAEEQSGAAAGSTTPCWSSVPHQPITKLVVMIVDAIRSDFYYEPSAETEGPGSGRASPKAASVVRNFNLRMPRLQALVHEAVRGFFFNLPFLFSRLLAVQETSAPSNAELATVRSSFLSYAFDWLPALSTVVKS